MSNSKTPVLTVSHNNISVDFTNIPEKTRPIEHVKIVVIQTSDENVF